MILMVSNHEMKDQTACFVSLSFAGLVVLARSLNPIPSRTRPLNSSAPMVLWLKPWESRSLPGLPRTKNSSSTMHDRTSAASFWGTRRFFVSGCSFCDDCQAIFGHDFRPACAILSHHTWTCRAKNLHLET